MSSIRKSEIFKFNNERCNFFIREKITYLHDQDTFMSFKISNSLFETLNCLQDKALTLELLNEILPDNLLKELFSNKILINTDSLCS